MHPKSPESKEQAESPLLFFDAHTSIGPRERHHPAQPWSLEQLVAEMDHCSISGALVADTTTVSYDPMFANLRLSSKLKDHPRLIPIWNVMPGDTGEFPGAKELPQKMREHNVRAVAVHPRTNAWDWRADFHKPLFRELESYGALVFIARAEVADYRELADFLQGHPALSVVLTGAGWTEQRFVLPLLRAHANLHLTFDKFQINHGLEDLVEEGLEDKLLFGSNAPSMSAGAHRAYVDLAEIPLSAKRKIAGGNLLRLLDIPPPPANENRAEDALMSAIRAGQPAPVPFLDMHMHILDEGLNGAGGAYRMSRGGPSGVFHLLRRMGCGGGGFMSWNGTVGCDTVAGNECVKAALDAAPQGYWGLASLDPTHYPPSELEEQMRAVYADPRFIGMKPYTRYGVEYHHPSYAFWWEYGNEHGFYAGLHRVRPDFKEVETLAAKYPNVRWVVYHCGASYKVADQAIECMRRHPNVFAEITLTPVPCGIIDYLVEHGGADRVLYGSDLPMRDPRQHLGWVVFSRLSVADKTKVLRDNALKVIAPCMDRLPAHCRPQPWKDADESASPATPANP